MIALTVAEIAELSDGRISDLADATDLVAGPVVADSRLVVPGSLFVAIKGDRVDGHEFAVQAISDGARLVLASRPIAVPAVLVDDTVLGLGNLARAYLDRLERPVVVGITGSSGKTSTKDIVAQLLATLGPTVAPAGSFNTEVGLPVTVLRADSDTRYLVLELSARGLGHIAYLCGIARPTIGVVLNVGSAHLGEFGSHDAVARAKGELVEALPGDGIAVLNADDVVVTAMQSRTDARVVTFGLTPHADVRAVDIRLDELARPMFRIVSAVGEVDVRLSLHGAHHVSNALAAATVALELGLDIVSVGASLSNLHAVSHWRMQLSERADGLTVINDAYNANPESMRAALQALVAIGAGEAAGRRRRTHAVLGVMAELGPESAAAHFELGATAAHLGVHRLVVVGASARGIADGAVNAGLDPTQVVVVDDVAAASALLETSLGPDDVVLVKASRSADLQRVAETLLSVPVAPSGGGR
ncbi:MAG TPA: UDP-N-acetylmuramoyl-tripeptide--D-alanyl-D-alanine ligase [Acidothermaceae bacterium]|nr:UDP-N-acetylmuramoyl-tripeptide--D-alanyl-D-alanine ligase [Acidothermaceae bacterium]